MIPGSANPLLLASAASAAGYNIERSLRFNSADSAYLSRTPSVAGNRRTWTWAGWVKGTLSSVSNQALFAADAGSPYNIFGFLTNGALRFETISGINCVTAALFRDPASWMHIVLSVDTSQSTSSDRLKIYVNGSLQPLSVATYPFANEELLINNAQTQVMCRWDGQRYYNGYLADIHFIDGQALDPTSFGEFDANGVWQPKAYTGTYGTNGFRLDFADNSAATTAGIGKDVSGNGNDWTPVNLSVAAGAGNDSLVDTPTSYGTDTGAGGEVRGNYCTLNPLASDGVFANGNLEVSVGAYAETSGLGTFGLPASGKWFWEVTMTTLGSDPFTGISTGTSRTNLGSSCYAYRASGAFVGTPTPGSTPSSGASYTTGDVIGVAYDADAATLAFYKNGSLQGTFTGVPVNLYFPLNYSYNTAARTLNFGQRPWAFAPPAGFKALCDTNLPAPVVAQPSTVMDVKLYTGNGSTQTISGLGFSPDFVWIKGRGAAVAHQLFDQVRGVTRPLDSSYTYAENGPSSYGLTAFNSDGFSLNDTASGGYGVNGSPGGLYSGASAAYAAWCWDAGSSTVTNTQGSITSTVRANPSAGFSIVTYTGTGSAATIGHGLGVAPQLIIAKCRGAASSWGVYHVSTGATGYLRLELTNAFSTGVGPWNNTAPTSTVFTVGTNTATNTANTMVAYCFAPVEGYSAFGSYTGNGGTDGPFVFTSMLPRWIMVKRTDTTSAWTIIDSAREGYNVDNDQLYANTVDAEATTDLVDIISNGFKLRTVDASVNASGGTYIYAAFAESPFQFARAR